MTHFGKRGIWKQTTHRSPQTSYHQSPWTKPWPTPHICIWFPAGSSKPTVRFRHRAYSKATIGIQPRNYTDNYWLEKQEFLDYVNKKQEKLFGPTL
jgi:hypothetical protein